MRLVSVPHTGTVYTRHVLGLMGLTDERSGGEGYFSHHSYELPLQFGDERIVVPLRDPMLAEISRINRGWPAANISEWDAVLGLGGHYFRVDRPDYESLAGYVGADPVDGGPPLNVRRDYHSFKPRYAEGEIDQLLTPALEWLKTSDPMKALFRAQGYDLLWM